MGGVTRVRIHTAEDIRHLGELDKKMWTVLSCPVNGLEISSESLGLMDTDGDGKLRVKEVIATAEWLCATINDPQTLFEKKDELAVDNIADEAIKAVAEKLATNGVVNLAAVQAAIDAVTIEEKAVPAAPLEADVMAAYKEKSAEYTAYYELEKLQKLGLATIPEETPKPGMKEEDFMKMGAQIAEWEAAKGEAEKANADALAAAKAVFMPLRKLLLIHRDFYRLLRNFITFEDFYDNEGNDYDASVFKIIDNPISIRQAFWTPYRKLSDWIEAKINKSAAEKDAAVMSDVTTKLEAKAEGKAEAEKPAFDIAKFAGIFAAIGMALGMIGTALASVAKGMSGFTWWQLLIVFVCILLVISGPSMIMAWMKLRRRNLAPVLNANGWAVNSDAMISVLFGRTLTEQAVFPIVKAPELKVEMAGWKKWLIGICLTLLLIAIICVVLHLCGFCSCCSCCQ